MKGLQTGAFRNCGTRGFSFRSRIHVLWAGEFVRGGPPFNTRILDASTHGPWAGHHPVGMKSRSRPVRTGCGPHLQGDDLERAERTASSRWDEFEEMAPARCLGSVRTLAADGTRRAELCVELPTWTELRAPHRAPTPCLFGLRRPLLAVITQGAFGSIEKRIVD